MYLIPHICHLYHLYIGGGKSIMWRNFIFPDLEKTAVSPHVDKLKKIPHDRGREIRNLSTCVWRMSPNMSNLCCFVIKLVYRDLRCFVAKYVFLRFTHFCVETNQRKNSIGGEEITNMRYDVSIMYYLSIM